MKIVGGVKDKIMSLFKQTKSGFIMIQLVKKVSKVVERH